MRVVNMLEAKSQLSRLVQAVESGAEREIVIARNGKPAVRLAPMVEAKKKNGFKIGLAKGKFRLPEDFDALDAEVEKLFYGEEPAPSE